MAVIKPREKQVPRAQASAWGEGGGTTWKREQRKSRYLEMAAPADEGAGAQEHQGDEELQDDPRDGGAPAHPADAGARGEQVLPEGIASLGLSQPG